MVLYPKDWNLWNYTHLFLALDSRKCWASCRSSDRMGPEPVWRWQWRGNPIYLFVIKPQLTTMWGIIFRAILYVWGKQWQ